MHSLTIYYSVNNGGDGSAYPSWYENQALADWNQEDQEEGWGEPCTGSITFESESPIVCKQEVVSPFVYLLGMLENDDMEIEDRHEEFIKEFFPDGLPQFNVSTLDRCYYVVRDMSKLNETHPYKHFAYDHSNKEHKKKDAVYTSEKGRQAFMEELQALLAPYMKGTK